MTEVSQEKWVNDLESLTWLGLSPEERVSRSPVSSALCYIAGPMRGLPEGNYPAFNAAAEVLRKAGWRVFNPAETDSEVATEAEQAPVPLKVYMRQDLVDVCNSDVVFVLPGWEQSQGARLEVHVAHEVGIPVYRWQEGTLVEPEDACEPAEGVNKKESVCAEADRLVSTDRQAVYGHPIEDFSRTAALWTALFKHKLKDNEAFNPEDVPAAMRMVKESRLMKSSRHRDSLVDIAGYAKTQELVWDRLEESA